MLPNMGLSVLVLLLLLGGTLPLSGLPLPLPNIWLAALLGGTSPGPWGLPPMLPAKGAKLSPALLLAPP